MYSSLGILSIVGNGKNLHVDRVHELFLSIIYFDLTSSEQLVVLVHWTLILYHYYSVVKIGGRLSKQFIGYIPVSDLSNLFKT